MKYLLPGLLAIMLNALTGPVSAALSVDRSRVIFNEGMKAVSVNVTNRNQINPYLAQGWIEDAQENKLKGPLMVLPPVQRVEADAKTVVRIQALPDIAKLPKDRESVFWFNLREIPPKNDKANTLTLAMQTRFKVFYRPAALKVDPMAEVVPGTENLTLTRQGDRFIVHNPTPYYFTFVELRSTPKGKGLSNTQPVMVAPKDQAELNVSAARLGATPVLMLINDYGSPRLVPFSCQGANCRAGKPIMDSSPATSAAAPAVTVNANPSINGQGVPGE